MKNILAENLLRFGVKNLSEDIKRKLQEQPEPTTDPIALGAGSKLNQTLGNVLDAKQIELLNQGKAAVNDSMQKQIFDNYYAANTSPVGKYLILGGISPSSKIIGPIQSVLPFSDISDGLAIWTTKKAVFNFAGIQNAYLDNAGSFLETGLSQGINARYVKSGDVYLNTRGSKETGLILPPYPTNGLAGMPMTYFAPYSANTMYYDYFVDTTSNVGINKNMFNVYDKARKLVGMVPMQIQGMVSNWDQTGLDIRVDKNVEAQIQSKRKGLEKTDPNSDIITGIPL